MDQKEVEVVLKELEERLDRLRAAYDQYFMGFEKLEPTIQRKEVDRRFAILRKEQIRNTALRYRFNVVTQKYSTYSMYWTRICRQIEEGTFKRHIQRAERRFGPGARREVDLSVDIDMGELDEIDIDMEMDAALAEAEAMVTSHGNLPSDTVPPERAPETPRLGSIGSTYIQTSNSTSFAIAGRRGNQEDSTPPPANSPANGVRVARPAALPAGAKPKIVRRVPKGGEGSPPPPSNPSSHDLSAAARSSGSIEQAERSSGSIERSSGSIERSSESIERSSGSTAVVPTLVEAMRPTPKIAPAAGGGARPQIRPAPGGLRPPMQSSPEIRAASFEGPVTPVRPPMQSSPELPGSAGRLRVRPPMQSSPEISGAGSSGRLPVRQPMRSAPELPAPSERQIQAPLSSPRTPIAPPSSSAGRPSFPDLENPESKRPSVPPGKARPPLPSQLTRKKD